MPGWKVPNADLRNASIVAATMILPSFLEALEPRIAPAVLLSASAFSYTDVDGDSVRVSFSKPILSGANFDSLVNISGGLAGTGPQDLFGLDLFDLGPTANGLNITVVATPSKTLGGDGLIAGLYINAYELDETVDPAAVTGIDLGAVNIDGDLTYIDVGDANDTTVALRSLIVKSVGMAEAGVLSDIYGPVGSVRVTGNFAGYFYAESGNLLVPDFKSITIGGSILGHLAEDAGRIYAYAGIGTITVLGDLIGGNFAETGSIRSAGPIGKVTINGSIIGGDATDTGRVRALEMGAVSLRGSLIGGFGNYSGVIETYYGNIGSIVVGGSIIGSDADGAATIRAGDNFDGDGTIGSILIKGSVIGVVPESGNLSLGTMMRADNSIGKITINGQLLNANIVAGIAPGADNKYGTADDLLTADFPNEPRKLGPIIIKSGVLATTSGYGITALNIASIQAGGPVLKPGGPFADFDAGFLLGGGSGIRVVLA
jgi:hypothetical protein